jgi:hypothetical protein
MPMNTPYVVHLPENYANDEAEIEDKGYLFGTVIEVGLRRYRPTFYNVVRLQQDVMFVLQEEGMHAFVETNVVVVAQLTRQHIDRAIDQLARGDFADLLPEPAR